MTKPTPPVQRAKVTLPGGEVLYSVRCNYCATILWWAAYPPPEVYCSDCTGLVLRERKDWTLTLFVGAVALWATILITTVGYGLYRYYY
jgi:hypothetical protein